MRTDPQGSGSGGGYRNAHQQVEHVPPDLLAKYFEATGAGLAFNREVRRCVILGRHDLAQDAPISRVDLLTCRNTRM